MIILKIGGLLGGLVAGAIGFKTSNRILRWTGLGLFLVTLFLLEPQMMTLILLPVIPGGLLYVGWKKEIKWMILLGGGLLLAFVLHMRLATRVIYPWRR